MCTQHCSLRTGEKYFGIWLLGVAALEREPPRTFRPQHAAYRHTERFLEGSRIPGLWACTQKDLVQTLGVEPDMIDLYIKQLEQDKKITAVLQERGLFYQTIKESAIVMLLLKKTIENQLISFSIKGTAVMVPMVDPRLVKITTRRILVTLFRQKPFMETIS